MRMARTSSNRAMPWHVIAMAIQKSTDGKRRVLLTDDEGLLEFLHYYGIETMESDDFKAKLEKDKVIEPGKGLTKGKHHDSMLMARRLDKQRTDRDLSPEMSTSTDSNSEDENKDDSNRRNKLGGIDVDM